MSGPSKPPPVRASRVRLESLRTVRRPTPQLSRAAQKTIPQCANPSCVNSDVREDDGKLICHSCGFVLSDVQITQELTFGEAANGAAVVQGVYVGANEESARNAGLGPSKLTGGMDSRQVTERNGQHHINNLVGALRLSATQKDRAYLMWTLAMNQNFIQGRVTRHVAAVCLYIACRQDKECRLMLVDFSDLLQMNVFKLGQIYTAFVEALNLNDQHLNLGLVNPENLIHRFAQDLEFGPDEHKIANEAVQVLKRLDRDWITTGRRPAGICGAALILAARMNNYRRTVREVVYTAKVCEITINKRLDEFRYTDSSKLTVEEFRHHGENLAAVHDPPAFYQQFETKKKSRRSKTAIGGVARPEDEAVESQGEVLAEEDEDRNPPAKRRRVDQSMPPPPPPIDPALLSGESEDHLMALAHAEGADADTADNESEHEQEQEEEQEPAAGQKRKLGRKKGSKNKPLPQLRAADVDDEATLEKEVESVLKRSDVQASATEAHRSLGGDRQTPPSTHGSSRQTPAESSQASTRARSRTQDIPDTEFISDSEFPDDPDLANAILSPEEVAIKERIWVHENRDYLRTQQARKLRQELAVSAGTARVPKKRSRHKKPRIGDTAHYPQQRDEHGNLIGASSPAESVKMMLSHRGYSKKLDYATVEKLYKHTSKSPSVTPSERGSARAASDLGSPTPARTPSKLSQKITAKAREPDTKRPSTQREPIIVEDEGSSDEATGESDEAEESGGE